MEAVTKKEECIYSKEIDFVGEVMIQVDLVDQGITLYPVFYDIFPNQ